MEQNVENTELDKFNTMAADWWDPKGSCRPLHELNPTRLQFITDRVDLSLKAVLDIGCGGGILSESMAKRGAIVTGIDAAGEVLDIAKGHAAANNLIQLQYFQTTAEDFAIQHQAEFEVITCLELLEHVPDPLSVLKAAMIMLKPNGQLFLSTLNRTFKAYALAILGAEYLLKLLPHETHDYEKFIRPAELESWLRTAGLSLQELAGLEYNPLTHRARLTKDVSVNYLAYALKPNLI